MQPLHFQGDFIAADAAAAAAAAATAATVTCCSIVSCSVEMHLAVPARVTVALIC